MSEDQKSKSLRILQFARQMELDGHNFFKEKAESFRSPVTKELFLKLAEAEYEHYKYIEEEIKSYADSTDDYKVNEEFLNRDESSIFNLRAQSENIDTTMTESDVPNLTVIRMAYLIEKDFKEFYQESAEEIDDPEIKKLLEKLADWEAGHERLFKTEYNRMKKEYLTLPWGG